MPTKVKPTRRGKPVLTAKEREHLKSCLNNLGFYCKEHLWILPWSGILGRLELNFPQRVTHKKIAQQWKETGRVRAVILKARQEGLSTYTAARFFRRVHFTPNQRAVVIADQRDKGANLFEMYQRFYENLIPDVQPKTRHTQRGNLLWLENGSRVVVDTAQDLTAGRSSTIHLLHASEFAFWPNADDTYISIAQTIPDFGSEVVIESTANGVGNPFHNIWREAEEGTNGFLPIFLPWWIHDEYRLGCTETELEEILHSEDPYERQAQDEGFQWEGKYHKLSPERLNWRRKIGIPEKCRGNPEAFKQEYPSTAKEAFLVSGQCLFDGETLDKYEQSARPAVIRGNVKKDRGAISVYPAARGDVRIWNLPSEKVCPKCSWMGFISEQGEKPTCKNIPEDKVCGTELVNGLFVIGADTAEGKIVGGQATFTDPESEKGGRDFSCADVFEVRSRRQVAQVHGRIHPDVFATQLYDLGYFYASKTPGGKLWPALVAVEKNHRSGETVLKKLQDQLHYPHLFFGRQINRRFNKVTPVLGWVTSHETRNPLLELLEEAVRYETIAVPNADTIKEMATFIRNQDGKFEAQEGCHDDRVIALAIALRIAEDISHSPPAGPKRLPTVEVGNSPTGWDSW